MLLRNNGDGTFRDESGRGGGYFRGASLSREDEWGIASEAVENAAKKLVEELTSGNTLAKVSDAAGGGGGIDMRVIKVDGQRAYINVGRLAGIKVGDKFTLHRQGEALIDPVTKMNLGSTEEQVGTGVVAEVQDRFAIVTITGNAQPNDVLKRQ